jgi:hypothetical protein
MSKRAFCAFVLMLGLTLVVLAFLLPGMGIVSWWVMLVPGIVGAVLTLGGMVEGFGAL